MICVMKKINSLIIYKLNCVPMKMYRCGKCGEFFGWKEQFSSNYCEYCGARFTDKQEIEISKDADIEKIVNEDWLNEH